MASRKRFHVPSIEEMEKSDGDQLRDLRPHQVKLSFTVDDRSEKPIASSSGLQSSPVRTTLVGGGDPPSASVKPTAMVECFGKIRETARHAELLQELNNTDQHPVPAATTSDPRLAPFATASNNSLLINHKQKGNPLIKFVRDVRLEYRDIIPDYVMGRTTCAIFLSLRYHVLYPDYIHERMKSLGRQYDLRILLVQVDVKESHHSLKELTKVAILANFTLLLAWSPEEAARHIQTYKIFENKPADILMKKQESDNYSKVIDALSSIRSINKSDAVSLLSMFGTLENIIKASKEDFEVCPGLGPKKINNLYSTLHEPFLKSNG